MDVDRSRCSLRMKKICLNPKQVVSFLWRLVNPMMFCSLILSLVATYFCWKKDYTWNPGIALMVSPVVFPLGFALNASYQRRERVLEDLATFKSSAVTLYFAHRNWTGPAKLPASHPADVKLLLEELLEMIIGYLQLYDSEERRECLQNAYRTMSALTKETEEVRASELEGKGPLCTRLIHYNNLLCNAFERIRVVKEYTTPRSVRDFFKVIIFLMPIIMAPYYCEIAGDQQWSAYYTSVVTALLFGSLQSLEDGLDDPFDGIGEDDINFHQLALWHSEALVQQSPTKKAIFKKVKSFMDDDELPAPKVRKGSPLNSSPSSSPMLIRRTLVHQHASHSGIAESAGELHESRNVSEKSPLINNSS